MCMYLLVSCQYLHAASHSCRGYGTIPQIMHGRKDACYERGVCDLRGEPGSGSPLYYINTWAMVWPTDYPAIAL